MVVEPPLVKNLITLLQKCRQEKNLLYGKRLHAYMRKHDLETHAVLGNYLVPMLADCGSLLEAQHVFDRLVDRNEYSWNSLISGYVLSGELQYAFHLYDKMQEEYVKPDSFTFMALLKASVGLVDANRGRGIHASIIKVGLERVPFFGNSLVDLYGKCELPADARQVFEMLPVRDAVSWNALIAGHTEHGNGEDALNCLNEMSVEGTSPDVVTFICSLKACGMVVSLETGQKVHAEITKRGLDIELYEGNRVEVMHAKHGSEREHYLGNTLVDMYARCGSLAEACKLFKKLPFRSIISWTALIAGYAEYGSGDEALTCFQLMQSEGLFPDASTFVCILKACASIRASGRGHQLCAEITQKGLERNYVVGSAMIDMYLKCGLLAEAQKVFDQLPVRNAVTWTALIAGYIEHGFGQEAIDCFQRMQLAGIPPVVITLACILRACSITAALGIGQEVHAEILKRSWENEAFVGNTLLDMYAKCSSLEETQEVFRKLLVQDVASWSAMIKACGESHVSCTALRCFEDMQEQAVKPDAVTFTCVLAACSHGNLVVEGQEYFKLMTEKLNIEPTLDHYTCMVDLLARSGQVYEAGRFIAAMQCYPSKEVLKALLSACKFYGEIDMGMRCFQQLVQCNQEDSSSYLLMADLFASVGRWSDAKRLEEIRISAGLDVGSMERHEERKRVMPLKSVTHIVFSFKGLRNINHLDGLEFLTKLRLDNNELCIIENLSHLKNLTLLDLSFNKIEKIGGLESLTKLDDLSLYSNQIKHIEGLDALINLTSLSLGKNFLQNLDEEQDYRTYVIGHLRDLEFLDHRFVDEASLMTAREQYQDEMLEIKQKEEDEEVVYKAAQAKAVRQELYKESNLSIVDTLFDSMLAEDEEYLKMKEVPGLLEALDEYRHKCDINNEEVIGLILEQHNKKKEELHSWRSAMQMHLDKQDKECNMIVDTFNKLKKKVFLEVQQDPSTGNEKLLALREENMKMKEKLLELEIQSVGEIQDLWSAFDDNYAVLVENCRQHYQN